MKKKKRNRKYYLLKSYENFLKMDGKVLLVTKANMRNKIQEYFNYQNEEKSKILDIDFKEKRVYYDRQLIPGEKFWKRYFKIIETI